MRPLHQLQQAWIVVLALLPCALLAARHAELEPRTQQWSAARRLLQHAFDLPDGSLDIDGAAFLDAARATVPFRELFRITTTQGSFQPSGDYSRGWSPEREQRSREQCQVGGGSGARHHAGMVGVAAIDVAAIDVAAIDVAAIDVAAIDVAAIDVAAIDVATVCRPLLMTCMHAAALAQVPTPPADGACTPKSAVAHCLSRVATYNLTAQRAPSTMMDSTVSVATLDIFCDGVDLFFTLQARAAYSSCSILLSLDTTAGLTINSTSPLGDRYSCMTGAAHGCSMHWMPGRYMPHRHLCTVRCDCRNFAAHLSLLAAAACLPVTLIAPGRHPQVAPGRHRGRVRHEGPGAGGVHRPRLPGAAAAGAALHPAAADARSRQGDAARQQGSAAAHPAAFRRRLWRQQQPAGRR
jgi:hypothetical protein